MSGKGSSPRPLSIPAEEFQRRWEETFGAKPTKEEDECRPGSRTTPS